jgi:hypothetical protein
MIIFQTGMTMTQRTISSVSDARDMLHLSIAPHPFAVERIDQHIVAGATVDDIMAMAQPDALLRRHAHVYLDGHYIPQEKWHRITPKPGTRLSVRMVPMGGGGGKNPLRTVLSMAVMIASPMLVSGLSAAMGGIGQMSLMGISGARLLTTGVNLLGRLALNAIAPPGRSRFTPNAKESPTLFIQGARNQPNPFGRVPKVLGRHRFVPPLGAMPYTETAGNDQYLRMLFVWGYGPLRISELKIGETPLSEFDDVEIETRHGYDDDAPITLYTGSVLQNDLGVTLTESGGYVTRTSEAEADEISVDITLPRPPHITAAALNCPSPASTASPSTARRARPKLYPACRLFTASARAYLKNRRCRNACCPSPPSHADRRAATASPMNATGILKPGTILPSPASTATPRIYRPAD